MFARAIRRGGPCEHDGNLIRIRPTPHATKLNIVLGEGIRSVDLKIPLAWSQKSPHRVSKFPSLSLKNPLVRSQKSPPARGFGRPNGQPREGLQLGMGMPLKGKVLVNCSIGNHNDECSRLASVAN